MRGLVDHQALLTLEADEYIIYFTALHVGLHFTGFAITVLFGSRAIRGPRYPTSNLLSGSVYVCGCANETERKCFVL